MKKIYICFLFCCFFIPGLMMAVPQQAFAVDEENTSQTVQSQSNNGSRRQQAMEIRRMRQETAARAREVSQRVRDSVRRTKESIRAIKERLNNTGADYSISNKERMRAIRETIERNKIQQKLNRQMQKDRMRMIRDQTESLQQKLRDNANRNK